MNRVDFDEVGDVDPVAWATNWIRSGGANTQIPRKNIDGAALDLAVTLERNRHLYADADRSLIDAHKTYENVLRNGRVSLSENLRGRPRGGRHNLIELIVDTFDDVTSSLFPSNSETWHRLFFNQITLPLRRNIRSLEDCLHIAQGMRKAINGFDDLAISGQPYIPTNEICRSQASLELLHDTFRATYLAFSDHAVRWCQLCFRRAFGHETYCKEHKPIIGHKGDTEYRKGRRLSKKDVANYAKRWARHRSLRLAFGDDINLVSCSHDVIALGGTDCFTVSPEIKALCIDTLGVDWDRCSKLWELILDCCPFVKSHVQIDACQQASWDMFCRKLLKALGNDYESTRHPFWILLMLAEAEDWYRVESTYIDMRRTDTKEHIIKLAQSNPSISQAEIARQLGLSRQRVSRIFKEIATSSGK